jgi:hypothetical protein
MPRALQGRLATRTRQHRSPLIQSTITVLDDMTQWLGRRGEGISDTSLGKLSEMLNPVLLLRALVDQVREMRSRGELKPDGLPCGVATVDGKNLATLQHHAGGAGHMRVSQNEKSCWWLMPALRSVLTSAAGRRALGHWMQPPGHGETTESVPFFGWLVQTYGELVEIYDFDAGFTSRANFGLVDGAGYGVVMGLKGNQPELHDYTRTATWTGRTCARCGWSGRRRPTSKTRYYTSRTATSSATCCGTA